MTNNQNNPNKSQMRNELLKIDGVVDVKMSDEDGTAVVLTEYESGVLPSITENLLIQAKEVVGDEYLVGTRKAQD